MKQFYLLTFIFITFLSFGQVPTGYYDSADGLTGFALKSQLKRIINDNNDGLSPEFTHNDQGDNLDNLYGTSDLDSYYENDGTILDIYSENPTGVDPYNYVFPTDECAGNFSSEGECYNKEHIIPRSVYNEASPMVDDGHTVIPVDGRVNGLRSNFPFGVVDDNQLISQGGISNPTMNGSKAGGNLNSGYSAGYTDTVFEPLDEFKGDVARMYFYFVTRYEDQVNNWSSYPMFDGTNNKALDDPFLTILLTWHANDPVSQKEIDRNNTVFDYQNNRNPFVDNPNYAALIWSGTVDTEAPTDPTNLVASNPTANSIDLDWTASTDNVAVTSYDVYINSVFSFNTGNANTNTTASGLITDTLYCFTIKARDAAGNESDFSNESCEVTLNDGSDLNCVTETFENIGTSSSSYSNVTWTGDDIDITWNATDSRTDQTLDNRAITIRNGILEPTNTSGDFGLVEQLTVTTQRVFSGNAGTFDLVVNGNVIGTIPYTDTPTTTTIPVDVISVSSLVINNNSNPSNRVMFDNLSWTCGLLSTTEYDLNNITIYPNPARGNTLHISSNQNLTYEVFSILGKKVTNGNVVNREINIGNLNRGIYIIKLVLGNQSRTYKLVRL
ncbi:endonuclease [Winogradskyella sp.]|uniref:endonuclease n=1 Tax=Winogradskyella sp. TaxID=1883156 RepID=UPI0026091447|nr:endonuclease [Winogradskyella sp.]